MTVTIVGSTTGVSAQTTTISYASTAGNTLLLIASTNSTSGYSVTDDASNTWSLVHDNAADGGTAQKHLVAYACTTADAVTTVTWEPSGATNTAWLLVELSPVTIASSAGALGTAPTVTGDLAIVAAGQYQAVDYTENAGWTQLAYSNDSSQGGYELNAAYGGTGAPWTNTGNFGYLSLGLNDASTGSETVTVHGATTTSTGSAASSSMTLTLPTCPAGALMYLMLTNQYSAATPSTPDGWTQVDTQDTGNNDNYGYLYKKTADSSDSGAALGLSMAAAAYATAVCIAIDGSPDQETVGTNGTNVTSLTIPAITPTKSDCLRLALVSAHWNAGQTPGLTTPDGWTQQAKVATDTGSNNMSAAVYSLQLAGQSGATQDAATIDLTSTAYDGLTYSLTVSPGTTPTYVHYIMQAGIWQPATRTIL